MLAGVSTGYGRARPRWEGLNAVFEYGESMPCVLDFVRRTEDRDGFLERLLAKRGRRMEVRVGLGRNVAAMHKGGKSRRSLG